MYMATKKPTVKKAEKKKKNKGPSRKIDTFRFIGLDSKEYVLTAREKMFTEEYLKMGATGPDAVIAAGYNVTTKKGIVDRRLASVISYENLMKPHVNAYIDKLMPEYGFEDNNVEKQHLFLLNQRGDLTAKKSAIDMYYRMKGRYEKDNKQRRLFGEFDDFDNEELERQTEQ